jgi:hypothetical protein
MTFRGSRDGPPRAYAWRQLRLWWATKALGLAMGALPLDTPADRLTLGILIQAAESLRDRP